MGASPKLLRYSPPCEEIHKIQCQFSSRSTKMAVKNTSEKLVLVANNEFVATYLVAENLPLEFLTTISHWKLCERTRLITEPNGKKVKNTRQSADECLNL